MVKATSAFQKTPVLEVSMIDKGKGVIMLVQKEKPAAP